MEDKNKTSMHKNSKKLFPLIILFTLTWSLIFLFIYIINLGKKKDEAISIELEIKSERLLSLISKNEFEEAQSMLSEIVHPSTENSPYKTGTNFFNEKILTYNEYWSSKRDELRKLIDEKRISLKTENKKFSDDNQNLSKSKPQDIFEEKTQDLPEVNFDGFIGLYIYQINGGTKFYKFTKGNDSTINIIYQDNISGNVRIENYNLDSFLSSSGIAILQSKKNPSDKIKINFKPSSESKNGFTLVDQNSLEYKFVPN
jgi:hypothetical protein